MSSDVLVFKVRPSHLNNFFYYAGMICICFGIWVFNEPISQWIIDFCAWLNGVLFQKDRQFTLLIAEISFYCLMFTPLIFLLYRFVKTELNMHYFYEDRLVFYHGVFNRHRENIEYYRVKDHVISRPLHAAVFGLSTITILSTDRRNPVINLGGFRQVNEYESRLRRLFEAAKDSGKGREVDMV